MTDGSSEGVGTWDVYGGGHRVARPHSAGPTAELWQGVSDLSPELRARLAERAALLLEWGVLDGLDADEKHDVLQRLAAGLIRTTESIGARRVLPMREVPDIVGSVVYYLRFGDRVKIGLSSDLARRLGNLPYDEILGLEHGARGLEMRRHRQFAHLRLSGEWFVAADELIDFIKRLPPLSEVA